jgi:uncharacterized protein (TIGR02001 family)
MARTAGCGRPGIKGIDKMKTLKTSLLAVTAALALGSAAHAQDAAPFALSFNVGAASDYVYRGISQTDEDPQIYGGVDASIGSIGYVGVWASNVDFGNGTSAEVDVYAGVKPTLGPVSLDLGVIYYGYVDSPAGPDQPFVEFKAAGSVPAGPATIGAAVYYSDEFFGETGKALYTEINAAVAIPDSKISVSGALGHQKVEGPFDYTTWNLGAGYALTDNLGVDVRYWDTSEHGFGKLYDSRFVVGIKASF